MSPAPDYSSFVQTETLTTFSVATNVYRGGNGERTEHHACVAWDRVAVPFLGGGGTMRTISTLSPVTRHLFDYLAQDGCSLLGPGALDRRPVGP